MVVNYKARMSSGIPEPDAATRAVGDEDLPVVGAAKTVGSSAVITRRRATSAGFAII